MLRRNAGMLLIVTAALIGCGPAVPPTPTLMPGAYVLDAAHQTAEKDQPCPI